MQENFVKKKQIEYYTTLNNYQKACKEKLARVCLPSSRFIIYKLFMEVCFLFQFKLSDIKQKIVLLNENLENLRSAIDTTKENHDPIDDFNILSANRDLKAAYMVNTQL